MPNWRELPLNDSRCTSAARDDEGYTKGYCRLYRGRENSIDQPTADDPYTASPDIWKNMDDFKARLAKFGTDAKSAASSVKDLDSFKAAFGNIGKNDCGACHEKYRIKNG